MSGFQVTPLAAFTTQNDEGFPDFLTWQQDGTNLGSDATVDTVNVVGSLVATRGTGESANVLTLEGADVPPAFAWTEVPGDYQIVLENRNGGLITTGNSGGQVITLPSDSGDPDLDFPEGSAILVFQQGAAHVSFIAPSGVELQVRSAFIASIAGQFGIVSLIKLKDANSWCLCGDMENF